MVRFSEIQQFPNFLELFPGNLRTICPRFENFGDFGRMVSAPVFLLLREIHKQQMLNVQCQNVADRARTCDLRRVRRT